MIDPLTDAVHTYLAELVSAFRRTNSPIYVMEHTGWSRGPGNVARRISSNRPDLGMFPINFREQSVHYQFAIDAIGRDEDYSPALDAMVGDEGDSTRFDADTVIDAAMGGIARSDGSISLRRAEISRRLSRLRQQIRQTETESIAIIPLPGLKCYRLPLALEPGIEIDSLTDDEVSACVSAGVLRPMSDEFPVLSLDECVGVRIRIKGTSRIVKIKDMETDQAEQLRQLEIESRRPHRFGDRLRWRLGELTEDILFVLRLANPEFLGTHGTVMTTNSVRGTSRTWIGRPTRQFIRTSYEIDQKTAREVRKYWSSLKSQGAKKHSLPAICARRFNAAMDRGYLDDAVIDYMIAAEALFLKDSGNPEDRGELGYRLSLRAAHFLGTDTADRQEVLRFMKRAYDIRSGIAHGKASVAAVTLPGGSAEIPMSQFVDELGKMMRQSLSKAVQQYPKDATFGMSEFWDRLILAR